jgi:hypothetical protein
MITVAGQQEYTRRVKLSPGQAPTIIIGKIAQWSYHNHVVRARAGQKLMVRIASEDKSAYFMVNPAKNRGETLNSPKEASEWRGEVPQTGEYIIHVGSVKGDAKYTLELALQ